MLTDVGRERKVSERVRIEGGTEGEEGLYGKENALVNIPVYLSCYH